MIASDQYRELISALLFEHDFKSAPRGKEIFEILNYTSKIDMRFPLVNLKNRKLSFKFAFAEAWYILSAKNDVESIAQFNSKMRAFSDDGLTFFGAYGPQIVPQLKYVVDKLIDDPDSRQAVATIWIRNPIPSKDIPCTVSLQWIVRNNEIYCIDTMRSSDAWLGWPYDVFNFTMMTGWICLKIRELTGRMISLGELYLTAGSQHLYGENVEQAKTLLFSSSSKDKDDDLRFDPFMFSSSSHLISALKEKADLLAKDNSAPISF